MTPEQLAEIKARVDAATGGKWFYNGEGIVGGGGLEWVAQTFSKRETDFPNHEANGEFIAHARQDIPALLAYIAELEGTT